MVKIKQNFLRRWIKRLIRETINQELKMEFDIIDTDEDMVIKRITLPYVPPIGSKIRYMRGTALIVHEIIISEEGYAPEIRATLTKVSPPAESSGDVIVGRHSDKIHW